MVQSTPDAEFFAEKYDESQGKKDIKNYTPSEFRESTGDELNGHLAANARMGRFIHAGGASTIKELTAYASVTDATLVDMQDGDAGSPIYVRTSKSTAESVSYTGSPSVTSSGNKKVYTYSMPAGKYHVKSSNGSGTVEDADKTGNITIKYTVSSSPGNNSYTGVLYYKNQYGSYSALNGGSSTTYYYGGTYKKSTLSITGGTDTGSGSATIVISPVAPSGGGAVTVTPYTPEVVRAQKIKQGMLTQATTRDLKYDYYTYIPSLAETETKTFLSCN